MNNAFLKIRQKLIRERKYREYLVFAIGEMLLIMIGILVALQIDNWNESQKEQNEIEEYAVLLIQDLEEDLIMIDEIKLQTNEIVARIDSLGKYIQNRRIEDISNLYVLCLTLNKPHRPYIWNRATVDELKSTGSLGYIKNKALSKMISQYYAFTHHLDVDYINDRVQFEKTTELITLIVNNNYPNFYELRLKLLPENNVRDYDFFESQEYKEAEAHNLKLLTNDINEVHNAINNYNLLMVYLRIRTDDELPRLTNDAEKLIRLLKETYID